jgi:hypothetical protein
MRIDDYIVNHKTKDLSMNMMKRIIMIMEGNSKSYLTNKPIKKGLQCRPFSSINYKLTAVVHVFNDCSPYKVYFAQHGT